MNKIFFLDRDGVINEEVSYLCDPEKMVLIPGAAEAVRAIHKAGFLAVVVTNQSGVARQMYAENDVHAVHARIQKELLACGADCTLDGFYMCCHHPEHTGECQCRKPHPGMLKAALAAFDAAPENSFMIGDRLSDLNAGRNAGCRQCCLVTTGYGQNEISKAQNANFPIAPTLVDAVDLLLKEC